MAVTLECKSKAPHSMVLPAITLPSFAINLIPVQAALSMLCPIRNRIINVSEICFIVLKLMLVTVE
jgi:hypothetical protein